MERPTKKRKRKAAPAKRKSSHKFRPFGRYADPLSSDSSDSDYAPDSGSGTEFKIDLREQKKTKISNAEIDVEHKRADAKVTGSNCKSTTADCFCNARDKICGHKQKQASSGNCWEDSVNSATKYQGKSDWNSAPTEILVNIFAFFVSEENGIQSITRCGRVCRQWYNGAKHPSLWQKLDLSFMSYSARANDKSIEKIVKLQGENIKLLNLSDWKKLTSRGLMIISSGCPNLETLCISGCKESSRKENGISGESIISVIKNCKLKSVDFSWIKLPNSGGVIHSLMEECGRHLISLNLSGCPVRSPTLNSIMESCPNLQILDISNTWIYDINIEKLQASCPHLEELYIAKSNLFMKSTGANKEEDLHFKNLTALSIQSEFLTDRVLLRITGGANNLKLLDLRSCRMLTMKALLEMEACNVERLFLAHACSSFSLKELLEKWGHSLHELDLSWIAPGVISHGLNDDDLGNVAKAGIELNKLRKLNLSGTRVNDEGVRSIVSICPNLQSLNLTSCKGLSRGIKHEHNRMGIEQLRKLNQTTSKRR